MTVLRKGGGHPANTSIFATTATNISWATSGLDCALIALTITPEKLITQMTTELRTLLSELSRPDLDDAAKQVVQLEIEKLLGRNARVEISLIGEKGQTEGTHYGQTDRELLDAHKSRKCGSMCSFCYAESEHT